MQALERYMANTTQVSLGQDSPTSVFAYKKAAKKVHPVATSLPEDFRIIQRQPEDSHLSLPPLPTTPPSFTPGTRLTQDCLDALN
jgi:hypothetical protein